MISKFWEMQEKWADFCEKHRKGFDIGFGIAFACAYAYYFFITSMITNICPEWLMQLAFNFSRAATLAGILLAALAISAVRNRWQLLIECVLFVFLLIYYVKGYYHPVFSVLMYALAATNRSSRKIVATTFTIGTIIMGASIVLDLTGILPKITSESWHSDKHALGMIYYTDAGAHILHLALGYCFLKPVICKAQGLLMKLGLILADLLIIGGALALAIYAGGRNNILMLALLVVGTFLYDMGRSFGFGKGKVTQVVHAIVGVPLGVVLSVFVYLIYTVLKWEELPFDAMIARFTDPKSVRLRIQFGREALSKYSYWTLFGNRVEEGGLGGIMADGQDLFFIDSSYLRIPVLYGLGIFCSFLAMMTWYQIRNLRKRKYYLMFLVCVALLSGVMEHHLLDFSYMFFIFLPFTREEPDFEVML